MHSPGWILGWAYTMCSYGQKTHTRKPQHVYKKKEKQKKIRLEEPSIANIM